MKKIFLILTVLSSMNLFSNNPDWTYQLCMGADITTVLQCVNRAIEDGFKPHHSLETLVYENNINKTSIMFYQVIIKE